MKKVVQRPKVKVKVDEIRRNSTPDGQTTGHLGSIDEVVVHDLHLAHLEQMDERSFWLGLTRGSRTLHLIIQADPTGLLSITVSEDELGCRDYVPGSPGGRQAPGDSVVRLAGQQS